MIFYRSPQSNLFTIEKKKKRRKEKKKKWLVILNFKIKAWKGLKQKKIDLKIFCEKLHLWFTRNSES